MINNATIKTISSELGKYIVILLLICWVLFPIAWMFYCSVMPQETVLTRPLKINIEGFSFKNYQIIIHRAGIAKAIIPSMVNSIVVALCVTLLSVIIGSLAGYSFARFKYRYNRASFSLLVLTRLIPIFAVILPFYIFFRKLKLVDTRLGLIIAYLSFTIPAVTWIIKRYIETIPESMEEAALVDGCSRTKTWLYIILPICIPGIMSAAIVSFIFCWNEFLLALVLTHNKAQTLPVALASLFSFQVKMDLLLVVFAGAMFSFIPPLVVTFVFQKYLIEGMTAGKGKD